MRFEHFALNVPDARTQAQWYVEHLGFKILRGGSEPPYMHFLGDETGRVFLELYSNPAAAIPDYFAAHPLLFHLAVVARDGGAERRRLEAAGATLFSDDALPDGTRLVMLRDPWGVPLQLCQRTLPFPTL